MKNTKGNLKKSDVVLVGYEDEENLGLRSIAAFLLKNGLRVKIEPYSSKEKERVLKDVTFENPKIVGFSLIFQRFIPDFAEMIRFLREKGVRSHFTIGGHFPSIEYGKTLEMMPELDTVVRHEGELTLLDLYHHLSPDQWPQVKGIAYRRGSKIIVTPPRPLIEDLDAMPFPLRRDRLESHRGLGACSILASRGCFFNCSFCSIRRFYGDAIGPIRRIRSPHNVVEEMRQLFDRGVRIFYFNDDDMGMRRRSEQIWFEGFAEELERRRMADQIIWKAACRVDELDAEILQRMREAGLVLVTLGIESGCAQGLKTCNKHFTIDQVFQAVKLLERARVKFNYGFMLIDPDSTIESIRENVKFLGELCENGRVPIYFTKMVPLAGTPIAQRLAKEGRLVGDISIPDYRLLDRRLDPLELFLSTTFHFAFFEQLGVYNRLQYFWFDSEVLARFFPEKYDCKRYAEAIRKLTKRYNDSVLETIGKALDFIEGNDYDDIVFNLGMLQFLSQQELDAQAAIGSLLDDLYLTVN